MEQSVIRKGKRFQVVPPCGGHHFRAGKLLQHAGFKSCPRVGGIAAKTVLKDQQERFKSCPRVGGI